MLHDALVLRLILLRAVRVVGTDRYGDPSALATRHDGKLWARRRCDCLVPLVRLFPAKNSDKRRRRVSVPGRTRKKKMSEAEEGLGLEAGSRVVKK